MTGAPTQAELDAARLVLDRMGVTAEDLLNSVKPPAPTFGEYIPVVSAAVSDGTRRAYTPYWNRVLDQWANISLSDRTPTDIQRLVQHIKANLTVRRNTRNGNSAAEHLIAALRCLYRHAVNDELIDERSNPAAKVAKPRRQPSNRRALSGRQMDQLNDIVATTGNDPQLDSLIVRFHTETAARRGGALALRPKDLDEEQCLVYLREKGETSRWQPVSPTLMWHLLQHVEHRGSPMNGRLLRHANGTQITYHRYDYLWSRVGDNLAWAGKQGVSTHWLRYTTLTWVERHFGYAVARAYAGHNNTNTDAGSTTTYIRATVEEVARALASLTGEHHPLAT
ncbi:tyrosine-type recombinase/integrase [Lentzea sp.]|uniref:tyrosine-type recombinase/integrase n=1 Tax=Lentzea sp. TaxID=56099 RepID=UPI002ED5E1CA